MDELKFDLKSVLLKKDYTYKLLQGWAENSLFLLEQIRNFCFQFFFFSFYRLNKEQIKIFKGNEENRELKLQFNLINWFSEISFFFF